MKNYIGKELRNQTVSGFNKKKKAWKSEFRNAGISCFVVVAIIYWIVTNY